MLNESYTKTYCAHPEFFGTEHVRLAEPAQLGDIIGADGFTIVLAQVTPNEDGKPQVQEIVATGSIKDFGDGDIESYAKWSKNRGGKEWAAKRGKAERDGVHAEAAINRVEVEKEEEKATTKKLELTAFAVSVNSQARGLGASVIEEVEWLLVNRHVWTEAGERCSQGLPVIHDPDSMGTVDMKGINVDLLKRSDKAARPDNADGGTPRSVKPKLVLMGIRELGNEAYYQRRGFKSVWSGTVPVGMWDCKKECTMVYMEKEIKESN